MNDEYQQSYNLQEDEQQTYNLQEENQNNDDDSHIYELVLALAYILCINLTFF